MHTTDICHSILCDGVQIKCGDKYADKAIESFTSCVVSEKKCVPQRVDESEFRNERLLLLSGGSAGA